VDQRSLNVIEISAIRKLGCGFLFAFYSNYGHICSRCEIFNVKEWRDLENQVRSRSRSWKMAPFDRQYATFYWSAIVNIALSSAIFELVYVEQYRDLEVGFTGHSMSLKLVPIESLDAVSYSPSIATVVV